MKPDAPETGDRRIRIVYLIWNLKPAGAERQLLELIRNMDRRHFEPHLVVFRAGSMDGECQCPITYIARARARKGTRAAAGVVAFLRLVRALRLLRPDVLHSFLPEILQVYGAFAAKILRVPVFACSRRASVRLYGRNAFQRVAERVALKMTDAMVVNAAFLREELVDEDLYPRERISLIANGVDAERFRPGLPSRVREFGWPERCFVIGMVANFRDCKRHEDLLRAAKILQGRRADLRFLLIGNDAGCLAHVKRLISELQLKNVVHVVDGCCRTEEIYGSMNLLVCTSDTEGLSNSILEAMACGLPVVGTIVGGNPELVTDEVSGILVPPRKPAAVADAIQRLADDRTLRLAMGWAARRRAMDEFLLQAMVNGYERLYPRLLSIALAASAHREPPSGFERIGG